MANVNLVDSNDIRVSQNNSNIGLNLVDRLDLNNDTSGANWQDMMKNKLDYCIANINTTKENVETFINGGWSGVNYGFGIFSKLGDTYQLIWTSSEAMYYCRRLSNNTYQYTNITGQDGGTATVNSSYISNVENNHYEKYGRVVSYSFTMTVTGSWNATTQFLSGLPKPQSATRFMGLNTGNQTIIRFVIDNDGNISNAYSNTTPSANHVIEGHITYIASE